MYNVPRIKNFLQAENWVSAARHEPFMLYYTKSLGHRMDLDV